MYAIYGNMDPINIPPMLAYIPAPWILWAIYIIIPRLASTLSCPKKVKTSPGARPWQPGDRHIASPRRHRDAQPPTRHRSR